MSRKNSDEPRLLEIRKYQNRRYYDTTRSQHIGLQQIHRLIVEGYDIRIVDAQTDEDITAKILTQILLEYEPLKLGLFSTELLTRAIRVNDRLLKDFVDLYFRQAFEAFCSSQKQFEEMLREAHQLTSVFTRPATWIRGLFPPWAQFGIPAAVPTPPVEAETGVREEKGDAQAAVIAALREEISTLKAQQGKSGPVRRRKPQT